MKPLLRNREVPASDDADRAIRCRVAVDPVLGLCMDRPRTRLGRYRVWMLASAPILMLSVYMLFMAPVGIGKLYLIGWLLVYYIGYSMIILTSSAWTAVLATNYHERSRVFGIATAVSVVGSISAPIVAIIAGHFSGRAEITIWTLGWFMLILTPVCIGVAAATTPEKVTQDLKSEKPPLAEYWALAKNPSTIRLLLGQFCIGLGPSWMSAIYIFFFTASRGFTTSQASILLLAYFASGFVGAPACGRLAMRIGKHRALMVTAIGFSAGLCTVMLYPKGQVLTGLPVMLWCGFMASGFNLMIQAMAGDLGDELRLESGKSRNSLVYAMLALMVKLSAALAVILTYGVLATVGYKATLGAANTPAAIHGLNLVFLIGPIFFVMLGAACFIGWKLDAVRHGEIRRELETRDAALEAARA